MKISIFQKMPFIFAVFLYGTIYGQITVSGTVSDASGPLPGANVLVKGTTNGTQSDFDGNFSLSGVQENDVLVISYIGYKSMEIGVNGRTSINITLAEDAQALDEVVIIGYGETTRRDATGSVVSVKAEDFNKGVIAAPEELIQGKSAGVQITSSSGEPGAGINIRIRGTSSVRSNNNPLFVVDGIPLAGDDTSAGGSDIGRGTSASKNPLNFINPNDIASIDVLKDASATAIYGSRGANGVVIITTKSGRGQEASLEYSATTSLSTPANTYDLLNRDQFLRGIEKYGGNVEEQDKGHNTDWQDQISRTAFSQTHNLSYANGHETGDYRLSLSYSDQQGVIENSSMERLNARLNLNQRFFNDKLKLGAQVTISRVNDEAPLITDNAGHEGDLLGATYTANPTWPADPEFQFSTSTQNPLSLLEYYQDKTKTNRSLINLSATYDFTDEFNVKVNTGFDNSASDREGAMSPLLFMGSGVYENGKAFIAEVDNSSQLLEVLFNYNADFEDSRLTALLGYSYQEFTNKGRVYQGWGFSDPDMGRMISDLKATDRTIRNAITGPYQQYGYGINGGFVNRLFPELATDALTVGATPARAAVSDWHHYVDELQSFFGRVNYTLKDRYIFTATLRADGSSKFGGNNKYGYFPSGAFAWILSDEDFIPDSFSNLKLRLGYGITGNQEIPHNRYQTRSRYDGLSIKEDGEVQNVSLSNVAFANPDLKWEQTQQFNIGVDFGFWDNRLSGSLDLYRKNTTDLLMQIMSAQPAPQEFVYENLDADVINQGFEITLNYGIITTEDLSWDFGANLSYNDNSVENFDGTVDTGGINGQGLTGAFAQRIVDGQPLFSYFLREFSGYDENGLSLYEEGDIQQFVGKSALPKYNLGISTSVRYKQWDLSAFFAGQFGHYIYNNTRNAFFTAGGLGNAKNTTRDVLDSPESNLNAADVSTRFLEKGDFLRLQNVTLGHNFTFADHSKFFKSFRVYLNAQNLFVITNYSGLDPEVNVNKQLDGVPSLGIDYTSYPRPRTFTLGLNARF
ncbi:SusC/RagA family TonB-linked outer membrane protein [Sinomicrobium soli]|uniref:SusC/RagA family TonB-linked outer membrane protein n=1 Tax=Sinomicrobium sp. N-1-3-6 TaxID=2219864 RepID=UPI000DCCD456|nr:TonB-dependent receptor [Sinomicrobium sp. N-1-3-6]RAV27903.1 SusC/RagA family TonB-linked outer membrane protein [Sinomicrobium sp. N-1-3-6]